MESKSHKQRFSRLLAHTVLRVAFWTLAIGVLAGWASVLAETSYRYAFLSLSVVLAVEPLYLVLNLYRRDFDAAELYPNDMLTRATGMISSDGEPSPANEAIADGGAIKEDGGEGPTQSSPSHDQGPAVDQDPSTPTVDDFEHLEVRNGGTVYIENSTMTVKEIVRAVKREGDVNEVKEKLRLDMDELLAALSYAESTGLLETVEPKSGHPSPSEGEKVPPTSRAVQ